MAWLPNVRIIALCAGHEQYGKRIENSRPISFGKKVSTIRATLIYRKILVVLRARTRNARTREFNQIVGGERKQKGKVKILLANKYINNKDLYL